MSDQRWNRLNEAERRQELALRLGFNPGAPETWPLDVITRLIGLREARGQKALDRELWLMMTK